MNKKDPKSFIEKKQMSIYANTKQLIGFMKVMKVSRKSFVFSIILSFFAVILSVITIRLFMFLLRGMISRDFEFLHEMCGFREIIGLAPGTFRSSSALFALLITIFFLMTLIKIVLQYASAVSVSFQVREATRSLRELIFSRYLSFGKLFYDRINLGSLSTILLKFSHAVATQLNSLQRLASQLFALVAYFGIMFFISWQLTLLTFCVLPFFVLLSKRVTNHFRVISKDHARSEERLDERIFSILSAIPLVKAHGTEEYEKRVFKEASEAEADSSFEMEKKEKLVQPVEEINMTIACMILACFVIFFDPLGSRHIADYLVFFLVVRMSLPGFTAISQLQMALSYSAVRISRILDILNDERKFIITGGDRDFEGLKKAIECKRLNFGYRENKPVLSDISLKLEKGKMTALVGPTGAGKTTLVHLLFRFYDCPPGSIFFDGKDIRDFTLKSLTPHFAYVSQDSFFFNDTLRMNVTYGLTDPVSDEQLVETARKARLYDFIMALPEKFETRIGERGVQLSGGEKQRLSIARALLRNAEILILDEATSSLDSKTESLIQDAIGEAAKGRTTIVIAHRFSTIRHADKIVVLEQGKLIEEGAREHLLDKKGKFYTYWNEQKFF